MQSAGVPTSLEPNCSKVAGSNPVNSAGDRADILCVLQDCLLFSDVSVTHCCVDIYVETAAATAGSAAEVHAAKKVAKYALREPGDYAVRFILFVPSQRCGVWASLQVPGGCPRRLDFSCVCAARVPVAPMVGAVLPCLWMVPW